MKWVTRLFLLASWICSRIPATLNRLPYLKNKMAIEIEAIRVRVAANQAHINIKQSIDGIHRHEFEYDIPVKDAEEMLKQTAEEGVIDKTRHLIVDDDLTWEIDEFHGNNAGLIVAEIELPSAD